MRIGTFAARLGITPHTVRCYERGGYLPLPQRSVNGYRDYGERDVERLRLLLGLRRVGLPLGKAGELAGLCAEGRCAEVSAELRILLHEKRTERRGPIEELLYVDQRLAHLEGGLAAGEPPRPLIELVKEDERAHAL